MLNRELKEDYIKTNYEHYNPSYVSLMEKNFELIGEYEDEVREDASNFTTNEILLFYKSLFTSSIETLINLNSIFSRYTRYMLASNRVRDGQNHYEEITERILATCVDNRTSNNIIKREKLLKDLEMLINPSDKFLPLALFEGICGHEYSDFYYLKAEDFREGKVFLKSGKVLEVSDKLKEFAIESAEEYTYYIFHYTENATSNIRYFDSKDECVLKQKLNIRNDDVSAKRQRIYHQLARIRKFFEDPTYNAKKLLESGRLDMIQRLSREQNNRDIKSVITNNKEQIVKRYGAFASNSIQRYLLKYGKYFEGEW